MLGVRWSVNAFAHISGHAHCIVRQARWRHAMITDLTPSDQWRKRLRGTRGPVSPVRSPATVPGLRKRLADAQRGEDILQELEQERQASMPDFAKAMQRCGELRDYGTLRALLELQSARAIACDIQQYGIIYTALARTSQGVNGRGMCDSDKTRSLTYGKTLWKNIQEHRVQLALPQYGAALGLCAKAGDATWAMEIWKEILDRGISPDSSPAQSQYLSALALHGGKLGWNEVQIEVAKLKASQTNVETTLLAVLVNAAGLQYRLDMVTWAWQELFPLTVRLNSVLYCVKAKALLLCGQAAYVPLLRVEMKSNNVHPCFRMLKNEAQAHLLLLFETSLSEAHARNLEETVDLARTQIDRQPVAANEVRELDKMMHVGRRIMAGEWLRLYEVRVERWPWRRQDSHGPQ